MICQLPFSGRTRHGARLRRFQKTLYSRKLLVICQLLFPKMKTMAGWYTIQAKYLFVRYEISETRAHSQLGTLGQVDSSNNWEGTIDSNEIQVFISPGLGAQFQVKVTDESAVPLSQVHVKVFKSSDIPAGLEIEKVWTDVEPMLSGITDFKPGPGRQLARRAMRRPEQLYDGCILSRVSQALSVWMRMPLAGPRNAEGLSKRRSYLAILSSYFLLYPLFPFLPATVSGSRSGAVVESGHVGVMEVGPGHWPDSGVEVSIGLNARTEDGVRTYGDSVRLWPRASVDGIHYNDLQNDGEIRGEAVTPLNLPLPVDSLPPFRKLRTGRKTLMRASGGRPLLNPGKYRDVSVGIFRHTQAQSGSLPIQEFESWCQF